MASAIIATDARELGHQFIGWALFAATALAYPLCWLAGAARLLRAPMAVLRETTHHSQGPQFLTIVAGTGLLGGMLGAFRVAAGALPGLFAASVALWIGFVYSFLVGVTEGRQKPPLETGISGAWLLVSVATASLAVIGSSLMQQDRSPPAGSRVLLLCLGAGRQTGRCVAGGSGAVPLRLRAHAAGRDRRPVVDQCRRGHDNIAGGHQADEPRRAADRPLTVPTGCSRH